MSNGQRQTGKTTRTLTDAAAHKGLTGRVLVVVKDSPMIRYCLQLSSRHHPVGLTPRDFCTVAGLYQRDYAPIRGWFQDDVFVDHTVWEEGRALADALWEELRRLPSRGSTTEWGPEEWCSCSLSA